MNLRRNLPLKIAAVGIAFCLWAWVAGQGDVLKTVRVPIDLVDTPAGLEIVGDIPGDIAVRLRGPEIALRALPEERVRVRLSLTEAGAHPGDNRVAITPTAVRVPAGIIVDRITPGEFDIRLERTATRDVPIRPHIQGRPAPGFEVVATFIDPESLAVEGPEPAVRQLDALTTPMISIDGVSVDQTLRVTPIPAGPGAAQVRLVNRAAAVDVIVRVRPGSQMTRHFTGVELFVTGASPHGRRPTVVPGTVTVEANGPRERLENLKAADLEAVLNLTDSAASDRDLDSSAIEIRLTDPRAALDDALSFRVTSPASVRVSWEAIGGR